LTKQGLSGEEIMKKVNDRDFELPDQVSLHYYLLCVDVETGKELWKREFHSGKPPGGRHRKNSFVSETPVTDGKYVYVYSTHLGLFAYDFAGNQVWQTALQKYPIYMNFGTGTSPVLCEDKLIIVDDNQEHSTIAAYATADGRLLWTTDRNVPADFPTGMPKSGWATPFVWKHHQRTEIITTSPGVAISYDTNGKELWRLTGVTPAPSSSSFAYDGLLYLDAGKTKPIYAIRPGATGDITPAEDDESTEFIAWMRPRTGTYIPTPVAYQGALYVIQDKGIAIRLDAKTGAETFKARISSAGGADFTSSPWAYDGKVFCVSEQGNTYVICFVTACFSGWMPREKGVRYRKCKAPLGPFRFSVPDPFFGAPCGQPELLAVTEHYTNESVSMTAAAGGQKPGTVSGWPLSLTVNCWMNGTATSAHSSAVGKPFAPLLKQLCSISVLMMPGFSGTAARPSGSSWASARVMPSIAHFEPQYGATSAATERPQPLLKLTITPEPAAIM
jgi:outer membrane protein assembly factor BamB